MGELVKGIWTENVKGVDDYEANGPDSKEIRPPGGGGGGNGMEARIAKLENDVASIKSDVGIIKSNHATKSDVLTLSSEFHKELHGNTWKIIGACSLLVAIVFFIAKSVH